MEYDVTKDDLLYLAGCSLAKSPGNSDNWIEAVGGELPEYICRVARAIGRGGRGTSNAIEIAVGRIKKWAAGVGGVTAATQGKAAAAAAEWEALKARAGGGGRARLSDVSSSLEDALLLSGAGVSFSLDGAKEAFEAIIREWMKNDPSGKEYDEAPVEVEEVWTDHLLVEMEGPPCRYFIVPFRADGPDDFDFGYPIEVRKDYVLKESGAEEITDAELERLIAEIEAEDAGEQNEVTPAEQTAQYRKSYESRMVAASQEVPENEGMDAEQTPAAGTAAEEAVVEPESAAEEPETAQAAREQARDRVWDAAPEPPPVAEAGIVSVPLLAEQSDVRVAHEEISEQTQAEVRRYLELR